MIKIILKVDERLILAIMLGVTANCVFGE